MECAFVGCGAAAEAYAEGLSDSPLSLVTACDRDADRAASLAAAHGAAAYTDLDAMLDAEDVRLVINLTSHGAHAGVTRTALEAGRHVWSEKPLALDAGRAADLVDLAERRGLALGCAPINADCEIQRRARTVLNDGRLGPVRLAYAHAHVGRVTDWHDSPDSFLRVGPLYDGAVYPLSLLVAWFGPARRVRSADALGVWPERSDRDPEAPTHVEATVAFAGEMVCRLTASFYAPHRTREFVGLELHGDDGSLYLADAGDMGGGTGDRDDHDRLAFARTGSAYVPMPLGQPSRATSYLAGPERLARSVRAGSPDRRTARRAAHVVAVCAAVERAATAGGSVSIGGVTPPVSPERRPVTVRPTGTERDPSVALRLPPVGFGCSRYRDGEYVDRRASIRRALDAGYRLLDSAELYGNETRIGEILAEPGSPDRDALFLASKVWNTNHGHVAAACEGTLAELGVEAVDCYLLHWPEAWAYTGPLRRLADLPVERQEELAFPTEGGERATADVSLESTWRRMERLHDRGLASTLGVCNVDLATLGDLVAFARVPPAVVQVECHPYRPREELVEWCHERGIRVLAHSPLSAPGLLADPVVRSVAEAVGVSPAAAVLAWNVGRGVVPIPSSTDPDHVVENLAAAGCRLDADQHARLDDLADPEFER
jgi:alcohol dehydrogenase (NADP+)